MLPGKSAPPTGQGTAAAPDRLREGGELRLLDDGTALLADAGTGRLLRLSGGDPGRPLDVLGRVPERLLAAAPLADRPGEWLVAMGSGFAVLGGGRPEAQPELPAAAGLTAAACDPAGRMWAATEDGAVLRLKPDGTAARVTDGFEGAAGLAFAPDGGTLQLADAAGVLHAVRVDPVSGEAGGRRVLARVPEADGRPAGMVTDGFGRLWCALRDGAAVRCFGPDGRLLLDVPLPAWRPSGVCVTGKRLLVSTGAAGLENPGPLDGAVLELGCTAPVEPARAAELTR